MRTCKGVIVKSGEPCDKPAQNLDEFCGYHSKREQARRSRDASAQWEGQRLLRANEAAAELVAAHKMAWCRARVFHALAGAHEQGVLVDVLDELFADTAGRDVLAAIADKVLHRWTPITNGGAT